MKIAIALLLFFVHGYAVGQTNPPPVAAAKKAPHSVPAKKAELPKTGALTGFVFAITQGGDLKPARLARLTLIPNDASNGISEVYGRNTVKQYQQVVKKMEEDHLSGPVVCEMQLHGYAMARLETMVWAKERGELDQITTANADEQGNFKITDIPAGKYTLSAQGQAGLNDGFWEEEVVITPGETASLKLSSPKRACLRRLD
jgi:hypothetical protein